MAAGTVLSGGFPGRVAQEVQPNQKCEGCLHYDRQAGRIGACLIGLRPFNCGDGDMQEIGYAPLARGAGAYLGDMNNHGAHAPEVETQGVGGLYGAGSTRPVPVQQVSLGAEHAHFVKSFVERHMEMERNLCRLHQGHAAPHGISPYTNAPQSCTCSGPNARDVAKALVPRLSNRLRAALTLGDVVGFVEDVMDVEKGVYYSVHGAHEATPNGRGGVDLTFHPRGSTEPHQPGMQLRNRNNSHEHMGTYGSFKEARAAARSHVRHLDRGGSGSPIGVGHTADAHAKTRPNMAATKSERVDKSLKWEMRGLDHAAHAPHGSYSIHSDARGHHVSYSSHEGSHTSVGGGFKTREDAMARADKHHQSKTTLKSEHPFRSGQLVVHNESADKNAGGTMYAVGRRTNDTHVHIRGPGGTSRMVHHSEVRAPTAVDMKTHAKRADKMYSLGFAHEPAKG